MIQEISEIQVIVVYRFGLLVLDHVQFHNLVIILVVDIVLLIENSIPFKLRQVQDTLNLVNNKEASRSYYFTQKQSLPLLFQF